MEFTVNKRIVEVRGEGAGDPGGLLTPTISEALLDLAEPNLLHALQAANAQPA
jgi:hypothetical protein